MSRVLAAAAAALLAITTPAIAAPPIPLEAKEIEVDEVSRRGVFEALWKAAEWVPTDFREVRAFAIPKHVGHAYLAGVAAKTISINDFQTFGWTLTAQRAVCGQTRKSPRHLWRWFWTSGLTATDRIGGKDFVSLVVGPAKLMDRTKPRLVQKFFAPVPFCMPDQATIAAWAASNALIEAEVAAAPEHCNDRGACLREFPPHEAFMAELHAELRDRLDEPTFVKFGVPRSLEDVAEGKGVVCGEVEWGETEQRLGGRQIYAAHWTYHGSPMLDRIDLYDDAAMASRSVPGCSPPAPLASVSN